VVGSGVLEIGGPLAVAAGEC